jgi:Zn-dependent protease
MTPLTRPSQGSFRLLHFAGIDVFVHWSWLAVAAVELSLRTSSYSSRVWNVAEYLALFGIVLLHEFGHALACRSVGGRADTIVLWPLGGIAFVAPPPRPGAVLWSIAAGPLVNVLLVPLTVGSFLLCEAWQIASGTTEAAAAIDVSQFLYTLMLMNAGLLVFNMLPIYPLDGGQILQALLWFFIGHARSLKVVSIVGLLTGAGFLVPLLIWQDYWLAILAAFVILRSWNGLQQARQLALIEELEQERQRALWTEQRPWRPGAFEQERAERTEDD